jgi:hypothetical protein
VLFAETRCGANPSAVTVTVYVGAVPSIWSDQLPVESVRT